MFVKVAISKEAEVNYADTAGILGKYDYGTFEENRNSIYTLLKDHKIHYTLSGHSHRSGLYHITNGDKSLIRSNMSVQGQAAKDFQFSPQSGCQILVAACGGPIAVQNHANEFFNWGLDYPSGNVIKTDGTIGIKVPNVKQAQPRLAVALDYADIFLRDKKKGGIFKSFESEENDGSFTIEVNPEAKIADPKLFSTIELFFYTDDAVMNIKGSVVDNGGKSEFRPDDDVEDMLMDAVKLSKLAYIKIALKASSHEHLSRYNSNSAWVYPIQLLSRKSLALAKFDEALAMADGNYSPTLAQQQRQRIEDTIEGYIVDRYAVYGEVPDLDFYRDMFAREYL